MKSTRSPSPLAGAAFFIGLILIALVAVLLIQNGAGPLVVGRSVGTIRAPASPAVVLPPAAVPLTGSGDWSVTLPSSYLFPGTLQFGNNGAYIALPTPLSNDPNQSVGLVYRSTDGALLQSYSLLSNASHQLGAARNADVIALTTVPNGSGCRPITATKFTSTQNNPVFSTPIGCTINTISPVSVSPAGGFHARTGQYDHRWFAPSNTSGVADASSIGVGVGFTTLFSGDGHYMYQTYEATSINHAVDSVWANPQTRLYDTAYGGGLLSCKASDLDGHHFFYYETTTASVSSRLMFLFANPSPTGTSDGYVRVPIDVWPTSKYCKFVASSDDGKTIYLSLGDSFSGAETIYVYRSEDGMGYSRVSEWATPIVVTFDRRVTADGARLMYYTLIPGHGSASQVQIFDRGKTGPTYLLDVPGEVVRSADLSPDGSKVALTTCSPSASPCTVSRLRVYDLSLIPTGVRAEYVSNPSNSVRVRWNGVSGALSYSVFRSLSADTASAQIVASGITGTEWVDTQVVSGQTYYYFVKARDTVTHFFSSGAKVLVGNSSPTLSPCPVEGAVLNANGTCTLTIPISPVGFGDIRVSNQTSWSGVQDAATGNFDFFHPNSTEMASFYVFSYPGGGGLTYYDATRAFFHADIPSLGGVALQSARLKIVPTLNDQSVFDSASTLNVIRSTPENPLRLEGDDYSRVSLAPSEVFASLPQSSLTVGTPAYFSFTSAGKSALQSASGKPFTFALVEGHHLTGNTLPPNGYNAVSFYNPVGTYSNPMTLEIVFTQ